MTHRAGSPKLHPTSGLPRALDHGSMLLTARDIRSLAQGAEIVPTKTKGQNFLLDPNTVRAIVERSGIRENDVVVEVGPGLGSLTLGLLEAGAYVGAIELDEALAALLPSTVTSKGVSPGRFALANADALKVTALPTPSAAPHEPTALVANLPYNVATPILLTMFEKFGSLTSALVMVQKEVAERIAATPGSKIYGAPSVKAAWYGATELAGKISRQVFWPAPNVDSALVRLRRDRVPSEPEPPREVVFSLIDAAFAQRRKTLRAALKGWQCPGQNEASANGLPLADAFVHAQVDPRRRGETLLVGDFINLARALGY